MKLRSATLIIFSIACGAVLILCAAIITVRTVSAATNISPVATNHWAWNDIVGWIDFYITNTVIVSNQQLTGYASSSIGEISLDCATTSAVPVGNICSGANSNYKVTNDGAGNLSGWGWNDAVGWISFDCNNYGGCGTSPYRVYIDGSGNFFNYAWNDVIGWISFNCGVPGLCEISTYRVVTSWITTAALGTLDSTTYDTGVTGGAQFNSIVWQGNQPVGTAVRFQFSASNSSLGPWNFTGPDGTSNTYYTALPNVSIALDRTLYNNMRYFRYRVILVSDLTQTASPRVDDVIVNWSP